MADTGMVNARAEAGVPAQLLWIDEVLKAPDMTNGRKAQLLYQAAMDYWRKLELAESRIKDLEREAFERVTALRLALRDLLDAIGDGPCRLDHHGNCQAHYLGNPCEVAAARKVLEEG